MVGVDLVFITEFKRQLKLGGQNFINKVFNENELKNQSLEHLAGLWAAKEAVFKASPNTKKGLSKDIKITNLPGKLQAELDGIKYEISVSHHGDYAVAVAVNVKGQK